ncbi:MAG: methyltransferase domain-containing protein [Akkermansiaceae bacterium]|nr:methyltransferase domain-containing protein [Akkermansiaceae bacterium]
MKTLSFTPNWLELSLLCILAGLLFTLLFLYLLCRWIKATYGQGYESFGEILHQVNGKTRFMNFGLWNTNNHSEDLRSANINLVEYVQNFGQLASKKNILDVGIGYGEQDFYWEKSLPQNTRILGIDISERQIEKIKQRIKHENVDPNRFSVEVGNAVDLHYQSGEFDCVVSLESAFHYLPRTAFFKESHRVLQDHGHLVVADICLLNKDKARPVLHYLPTLLSAGFMGIPKENLVSIATFKKQLEDAGYEVDLVDVTTRTYTPFYTYFGKNYRFPRGDWVMTWILQAVLMMMKNLNPFAYVICVCKKDHRRGRFA